MRLSGSCAHLGSADRWTLACWTVTIGFMESPWESEQIRAFGFSPDGTMFIIATSPGLAIYRRGDR